MSIGNRSVLVIFQRMKSATMTRDGMIVLSSWKEKKMIEFMLTVALGNLLMFAMVILIIGLLFVLRVMLNVWFDTDFMKRIVAWFKEMDERVKAQQKKKAERQKIKEAEARETWVIEGEKDDIS